MFWTAFVWGLGASCGGGFGLIAAVVALHYLERFTGVAEVKAHSLKVGTESLDALLERNVLTTDMIAQMVEANEALKSMAKDLDWMADKQ